MWESLARFLARLFQAAVGIHAFFVDFHSCGISTGLILGQMLADVFCITLAQFLLPLLSSPFSFALPLRLCSLVRLTRVLRNDGRRGR